MRYVVLDTNALVPHWRLDGARIAALLDLSSRSDVQVIIPEVVVLEFVNKYREELVKVRKLLDQGSNAAKRIGLTLPPLPTISVQEEMANYEAFLRSTLAAARVIFGPIPSVAHQTLLESVLARRPPFGEDDRGYRDALIWETLRALSTGPVEFVTSDKIFYAHRDSVGTALNEALPGYGDMAGVAGYRTIGDLLEGHLSQSRQAVVEVQAYLEGASRGATVARRLERALIEAGIFDYDARHRPRYELEIDELPRAAQQPTLEAADVVGDVKVKSAQLLRDGRALIEMEVDMRLLISFFGDKADAYGWSHRDLALIYSGDPNDDIVACEVGAERTVLFAAHWAATEQTLSDISVDAVW